MKLVQKERAVRGHSSNCIVQIESIFRKAEIQERGAAAAFACFSCNSACIVFILASLSG
jgi:hypothetical protein